MRGKDKDLGKGSEKTDVASVSPQRVMPKAAMTRGPNPAILLSCAVFALALPSAVLAFTSNFDQHETDLVAPASNSLIPATVDPTLARAIRIGGLSRGQMFRFTPADTASRPDRAVTVAVRVDPATARSITMRKTLADGALAGTPSALRISQTAYSLGVARGYQGFTLPGDRGRESPDLSAFRLRSGSNDEPSRLNARIAFDEREKTGRLPRTLESNGEQTVDVGGSFSLTRNLDVTAGVRYSQERDRLLPQNDAQKDSQAVYVGTQFRF